MCAAIVCVCGPAGTCLFRAVVQVDVVKLVQHLKDEVIRLQCAERDLLSQLSRENRELKVGNVLSLAQVESQRRALQSKVCPVVCRPTSLVLNVADTLPEGGGGAGRGQKRVRGPELPL